MHYYLDVIKKYAVFSGRTSRKEYWMFVLFNFIIGMIFGVVIPIVRIAFNVDISIIVSIYQLAIIIPSFAVGVRRIHDTNKSGWYVIFPIYNIVLLFIKGTRGDNRFGPDPKRTGLNQDVKNAE